MTRIVRHAYRYERPPLSALVITVLVVAGCTTSEGILRPGGQVEYLVACGAGTGWNICYSKANELCPSGYTTLSEDAGFNRKEMHIACPGQSTKP
jgi:hypothetical protein